MPGSGGHKRRRSAVKIKIGYGIASDFAAIRAVREVIRPDTELMIDANHGNDMAGATEIGRRAAENDIGWLEEPVAPETLSAYQQIRARQPIPVAEGETRHCDRAVDGTMTTTGQKTGQISRSVFAAKASTKPFSIPSISYIHELWKN